MVIISITTTYEHEGDTRTLGRIARGIERMEESGYLVERYDHHSPEAGKTKKMIMAVTRTKEADDTTFEEWLQSLWHGNEENRKE